MVEIRQQLVKYLVPVVVGLSIAVGILSGIDSSSAVRLNNSDINQLAKYMNRVCGAFEGTRPPVRLDLYFIVKGTQPYQNLFQTSELNHGIRAEITDQRKLAVIVGDIDSDIYSGIETDSPLPNGLLHGAIFISKHTLGVAIENLATVEKRINARPSCDSPAIGWGYTRERHFLGFLQVFLQEI